MSLQRVTVNLFKHLPTILSRLGDWVRENGGLRWLGVLGVLLTIFGIWIAQENSDPDPIDPSEHASSITVGGDITGPAIVGTQTIQGPVTIGYTPEELHALIADQARLTKLEAQLEVRGQALRRFFEILEQEEVPPEQWPVRLGEIAERHKQALERLAELETEDSEAQALIGKARAAIEAGDYGRAENLLDQAEARELAGIQAAQAAVERRRLSAAAVRAELSLIQLRYRKAAERFAAAELVPDTKPEQRLAYREQHADALYRQGDEKGDNAALMEAIRAYRDLLEAYPRARVPLQWAATQNNLGNALQVLGEREADTARLEEAVAAYRVALQERTRERVPLDWAQTQNNLGSALQTLGERESGTARLEEAVAAYRAALRERTRDRVPLQWAATQNNLGGSG